jgi:hypothetical protein
MDTILIYDKETGNIDGCVNAQSIDYFLNGTLSPVYVQAKTFDDQGNEVGETDIHLYDPDHGFLWNKEAFPTLHKGVVYLTTKTESEIKAEEIDTIVYQEHKIPYIINGREEEKTYYSNAKIVFLKEIASNGKVTITPVKRKRILEEQYSDLIAGFTAEGIDFENESEATAKILREYKVVVDSATQAKTLVLRG